MATLCFLESDADSSASESGLRVESEVVEVHGYDCKFVQPPPTYLQTECSVCLLVLRSPHLTSCCGHNFCKECIERIQRDGSSCPLCNVENFTLTYNRAYDVSLKQLEVYCIHREIGCEWKGKLETLDKHLNVGPELEKQLEGCAFVEVQCYHDGCGQSLQRRLRENHQANECPQRPFSCEHCEEYESTYHDVTTNHWPVCVCYPVSCPNGCTETTFQRQNLDKHLNEECPLQEVECDFTCAGCETKLPRKDMADHVSDSKEMVRHMTLLARQNQRLGQEVTQLVQENQNLAEKLEELSHLRITPIQIVFKDFERHKRDKDLWYSEGFYTHPQGYKMCLKVCANGGGAGAGTHVTCSIFLMAGAFDNHLRWPFQGAVTAQLLNQREDSSHNTNTINFDTALRSADRVTCGKRASAGRLSSQFIPHSELGYNATTNCQYLINDCLYFRVKANI